LLKPKPGFNSFFK